MDKIWIIFSENNEPLEAYASVSQAFMRSDATGMRMEPILFSESVLEALARVQRPTPDIYVWANSLRYFASFTEPKHASHFHICKWNPK